MDKATLKIKIDTALNLARNLLGARNDYSRLFWAALVILIGGGFYLWAGRDAADEPAGQKMGSGEISATSGRYEGDSADSDEPALVQRKLDGIQVPEGGEDLPVLAVMIENHADSRPPASLSKAGVVYEAEAEGGITRFLALYATDEKLDRIGPVRSARPYYIDWAQEYGALYVHCGGSPVALAKIAGSRVFGLDEFYNSSFFWRDKSRPAPHNVYSSSGLLYGYYSQRQKGARLDYDPWKYKDDAPEQDRGNEDRIGLPNSRGDYGVEWRYDRQANRYSRWYGRSAHQDEDGSAISAKNVIVMFTAKTVADDEGRLNFKTTGGGQALFCLDGSCREGSWSKESAKSRTGFAYRDNSEVRLNSGNTWIEVLPTLSDVNLTTTITD